MGEGKKEQSSGAIPGVRFLRLGSYRSLILIVPAAIALLVLFYSTIQGYVLGQVEMRVRDTMLESRALHQYVQHDMHPAYYRMMDEGYLPGGFYAPELLSSSFMTRNMQRHYNEERRREGLPEVVYKMAAIDPRNVVNRATPLERELIEWFDEDRSRTSYSEVIEEDGKRYLLYAQPFLEVKERCLKCHGAPEDAPAQLRDKYDWTGAWNLAPGQIVAAEFVRSPLEGEFDAARLITGALCVMLLLGLLLLAFNNRLGALVTSRTAALDEERQRFANVIEGVDVGTWDKDLQTGVTIVNERWAEMAGYTLAELEPVDVAARLELMDAEGVEAMNRALQAHLDGEADYFDCEYRLRHRDGHWVWLHDRGRIVTRDENGSPLRLYGTTADVTEEVRLREENERIEAEYRQVQKVESVGRLAGGVAHDLNNLLSPVIGYSEMLIDDLDEGDDRRHSASEIMAAGMRARDLVRQLLAFSRKQTLAFEPVQLNESLEGFRKLLRTAVPEHVDIEFRLADGLPPILADIGQIEQIFMNLAVNAADAMPGGGRLIFETAPAELEDAIADPNIDLKPGEYILFAVSDTGTGMDTDVREKIFEPFYSTKGDKGTGLGLATVYGIVKQHGGNIWVYSEPGRGTTFKIFLPAAAPDAGLRKKSSEVVIDDLTGSETVLLVEDDAQVCELTRRILERQGYDLLVASGGAEALDLLEKHDGTVHLLLTDVVMPSMNGRELHARAIAKRPNLRVLYMSGYTDDAIDHHGVLDQGVQFLQKPFTAKALLTKIRTVLEAEVLEY